MQADLIIVNEYCSKSNIDPSFILMLEEDGLIDIQIVNKEKYILESQLADLERYSRLYYDLSINTAGISAIHHLLKQIEGMQQEIYNLKSRLSIFQTVDYEDIDEF